MGEFCKNTEIDSGERGFCTTLELLGASTDSNKFILYIEAFTKIIGKEKHTSAMKLMNHSVVFNPVFLTILFVKCPSQLHIYFVELNSMLALQKLYGMKCKKKSLQ